MGQVKQKKAVTMKAKVENFTEDGWVAIFAYLFSKFPQPGDSKVAFAVFNSSCHLLLPIEPLEVQAIL